MLSLADLIEQLSYSMEQHETKVIAASRFSSLTAAQIHCLDMISHPEEGPTFSELAERLSVSKPSVTVAVEKLETQGYLRKVQSTEDKRSFNIYLTDEGKMISKLHDDIHRGYAESIERALTQPEVKNLKRLLSKALGYMKG